MTERGIMRPNECVGFDKRRREEDQLCWRGRCNVSQHASKFIGGRIALLFRFRHSFSAPPFPPSSGPRFHTPSYCYYLRTMYGEMYESETMIWPERVFSFYIAYTAS
jgi:hypothetical protein